MTKFSKYAVGALSIAAIAAAGAALGQSGRIRPPAVSPGEIKPVKTPRAGPPQPVQSDDGSLSSKVPPKGAIGKSVGKSYVCQVEMTETAMMQKGAAKSNNFTISALSDGTLVYGGNNPLNISRRYQLVDSGDWRVMTPVGWIEGREPPPTSYGGSVTVIKSGWSIEPKIHRATGDFSSVYYEKAAGINVTRSYTGTCTGGV